MPTLAEDMWTAFDNGEFDKIQPLIEKHPGADLVNAINPGSGTNLPIRLITNLESFNNAKPLIVFVLTLKDKATQKAKMNWDFTAKGGLTAVNVLLDAVYNTRDFVVMKSLGNVDEFFFNNKTLTYDLAIKKLTDANNTLQRRINTQNPAKDILKAQESVDKWKEIVSVIREMTIPFAKKTGNTELLRRLEQDKATAALEASLKSLSANLARYGALKTERQQIQQDHALKELELAQQNAQDMQELLNSAVTATAR